MFVLLSDEVGVGAVGVPVKAGDAMVARAARSVSIVDIWALLPLPDGASTLTSKVGIPSGVGDPVASVAKLLLYEILTGVAEYETEAGTTVEAALLAQRLRYMTSAALSPFKRTSTNDVP